MALGGWARKRYTVDSDIPHEGEIIRTWYPMRDIPFLYGPDPPSTIALSAATSANGSTYSLVSTRRRGYKQHHMLVLKANHDSTERVIKVDFMPIMAHTNAPPWYPGGASWNSQHWMDVDAADIKRLHHLPIPAVGWTAPPSLSDSAPILTFDGWLNNRPSWLALISVSFDIPDIHPVTSTCGSLSSTLLTNIQWYRRRKGPVILDGDASRLYLFLFRDIPRAIKDLQTAANAARVILPAGPTASTSEPTTTDPIQVSAEATGLSDATVNTVIVPNYYHVWAEFYGLDNLSESNLPDALGRIEAEFDHSSEEGLDSAMSSDSEMDPIPAWNLPGASKGLLKIAQDTAKKNLENKIREWDTTAASDADYETDLSESSGEGDSTGEDDELDVAVIEVGEEACGGN